MNKCLTINLGPVEKIALGFGQNFIIQSDDIGIFRAREGKLFAIENRCPHRQGPLSEGITGSGKVICPLHGHKFDLTTGEGSEPNECVRVFKVWEENKEIMLEWTTTGINPSSSKCAGIT